MNHIEDDLCPFPAETGNPCCLRVGHDSPCRDEQTIQERAREFFAMLQKCNIKPIVVDGYPDGSIANPRTLDPVNDADELQAALGIRGAT